MFKKTILGTLTTVVALATSTVAFAETRTASSTHPLLRDRTETASSTKMVESTCAKTAVDARKTSLMSIYGKLATSLSSALSTREDAVKASFDLTTKKTRQEARKAARSAYKKSVKSAYDTLKTAEKSAMKTYTSSIKACGGTNAEASDESSDGSFADSIK